MAAQDKFLRKEFSGSGDNPSSAALQLRRGITNMIDSHIQTAVAVIVKNYSPQLQRVTLVEKCKNQNNARIFHNVPIAGTGGGMIHLQHIKTLDNKDFKPTSGVLLFTKENTSKAWENYYATPGNASSGFDSTGVFIPGPMITGDGFAIPDEGAGLPATYEYGDEAFIHKQSGAHIIFKNNGDLVIMAGEGAKVYIGNTDMTTEDFKNAARKEDKTDVGPAVSSHDHEIKEGSDTVFIGGLPE